MNIISPVYCIAEDKAAEMDESASFVQRLLLAVQQALERTSSHVALSDMDEPIAFFCARGTLHLPSDEQDQKILKIL